MTNEMDITLHSFQFFNVKLIYQLLTSHSYIWISQKVKCDVLQRPYIDL